MKTEEYIREILEAYPEYAGSPFFLGKPFTDEDKAMIAGIQLIIPSLAEFLGQHCEVVLHSLEDPLHSVICAVNSSLSRRKEGDPIYNQGFLRILEVVKKKKKSLYFGKSISGIKVRAGIYPVINKQGRCLGSLSFGFNVETPLINILHDFYVENEVSNNSSNFGPIINIEKIVQEVSEQVQKDNNVKNRARTKEVIRILVNKKVFEVRNAVNIVANLLGASPATVYWHLRELKQNSKKNGENYPDNPDGE